MLTPSRSRYRLDLSTGMVGQVAEKLMKSKKRQDVPRPIGSKASSTQKTPQQKKRPMAKPQRGTSAAGSKVAEDANSKPTGGPTIGEILSRLAPEWGQASDLEAGVIMWPPDLFAVTSVLLEDSDACRFAVSPPSGRSLDQRNNDEWNRRVSDEAYRWLDYLTGVGKVPPRVKALVGQLASNLDMTLAQLGAGEDESAWNMALTLMELHALADETCAGIGVPTGATLDDLEKYWSFFYEADVLLNSRDTLSRAISPSKLQILPKARTPQIGISVRSLSLHVCVHHTSATSARWHTCPGVCETENYRLNILLVPWPATVKATDFVPSDQVLETMDSERFGFFKFEPQFAPSPGEFRRILNTAASVTRRIDGVVFPELSLSEEQERVLRVEAKNFGLGFILAGLGANRCNFARLLTLKGSQPREIDQHKHHRWCLEEHQIATYGLGFQLTPAKRWWEDIQIKRREMNFVSLNAWLTLCHLICEDLARLDPVSSMIRAVGPNLVVALLQDGPQLESRWSARYATVLADDPGASVLTLTSIGMALRSVPDGCAPKRVVGLWKDQSAGVRHLSLEDGNSAILLGISPEQVTEHAADGRSDGGNGFRLVLKDVVQIK